MTTDYARIESAIHFIRQNVHQQPSLDEIASEIGLSPYHFQRLFSRWAGISPKRFLQVLTLDYAKQLLRKSASVLDATYELGLSSPARIHDHFVSLEAVTPGEFKQRGEHLRIDYGVHPSPFGSMLITMTQRGICGLSFVDERTFDRELMSLRELWHNAEVSEDTDRAREIAQQIFIQDHSNSNKFKLLVRGTNFQVNVWKALLKIPLGFVSSYQQVANAIGHPASARAVGNAIASNAIGYLIPCHRVIQSSGNFGNYRWDMDRKQAILAWEGANAALDSG